MSNKLVCKILLLFLDRLLSIKQNDYYLGNNILDCEIIDGPSKGKRIFIPKFKLREIDYECGYKIERFQFPVSLGYALTINKSQGQTFNQIGLELQTPVFSHGQLYVALSRVRSFNNLKIRVLSTQEQGKKTNVQGTFTKNIVFREILVISIILHYLITIIKLI